MDQQPYVWCNGMFTDYSGLNEALHTLNDLKCLNMSAPMTIH